MRSGAGPACARGERAAAAVFRLRRFCQGRRSSSAYTHPHESGSPSLARCRDKSCAAAACPQTAASQSARQWPSAALPRDGWQCRHERELAAVRRQLPRGILGMHRRLGVSVHLLVGLHVSAARGQHPGGRERRAAARRGRVRLEGAFTPPGAGLLHTRFRRALDAQRRPSERGRVCERRPGGRQGARRPRRTHQCRREERRTERRCEHPHGHVGRVHGAARPERVLTTAPRLPARKGSRRRPLPTGTCTC